ncbi:DJ-1/PfpI family protein [Melioribacter sp. OK-6-Me]|uniref:DJ-1/PfpI family protein n=1 Tax=unclassified Melioribacter TaxID=2627329 RepID=UPI003EDA75E2
MERNLLIPKSLLLFLPQIDFSEEEYLAITSVLKKERISYFIASDATGICLGSTGLKVKNDIQLYNIHPTNFEGLIIVGGAGARNYKGNQKLIKIVQAFNKIKKPIGAICSAPLILAKAGVLGEEAVCYPSDKPELISSGIKYKDVPVVKDGRIITARDPQSAIEFIETFISLIKK